MRTPPGPSVTVQSVLYCNGRDDVTRMVTGIANAVKAARQFDAVGRVVINIGDCSPTPMLTGAQLDELRDKVEPWGISEMTYEFFADNLGSAAGHNRLLSRFASDFVLFLNPDTFASPFMLYELGLALVDPSVGIAEARQVPLEHPKSYDHLTGDTSWASTAGCLVKRQVVDAVEGFDADAFFLYCDDVDFSWRARLAGFRVVLQPTARLFHDKRLTIDAVMETGDAEFYYSAEAALMLAWKYSRPDLVDLWLDALLSSPFEHWVRAATAFAERKQKGGWLPVPIDPKGAVAHFVGMNFADHRFLYSD